MLKLKLLSLCVSSLMVIASSATFAADSDMTQDKTSADNSRVNQRDQVPGAVNAETQGNSKTDLALTQKIRRAVMKRQALSFNAKNIKIITRDGQVTLMGPVKSMTEKNEIERIANRIAGNSNVWDQIEIAQ